MPDRIATCSPRAWPSLAVNQGYRSDWSALFAGLVIAILPVLVVYVVFQRRIQEGLAFGGFK